MIQPSDESDNVAPLLVLHPHSSHRLFVLNMCLAAVFSILAILVAVATYSGDDATVPLYFTAYVRDDSSYRIVVYDWTSIPLGYLSCVFLSLAAIDHAVMCCFRTAYEHQVAQGRNTFRWIEYFFSASIMNMQIAAISGILDIQVILAVGAFTAICQLGGAIEERCGSNTAVQLAGFLPFLFAWSLIFLNFGTSVHEATGTVPPFVIAIVCVLFFLECLFPINQLRPVADHVDREYGYLLLSIISKATLAGLTWGGILAL